MSEQVPELGGNITKSWDTNPKCQIPETRTCKMERGGLQIPRMKSKRTKGDRYLCNEYSVPHPKKQIPFLQTSLFTCECNCGVSWISSDIHSKLILHILVVCAIIFY